MEDLRVKVDFGAYLQHSPPILTRGPMGIALKSGKEDEFGKTLTAGESQQLNDENVEEKRGEILEWFRRDEEGREWIKLLNILFSMASLAITGDKRLNIKTIVDEAWRRAEATKD
ncbi:predicted protein [Histoplasma capsulatum G186AR]|uniref:Uncharacterized protein n=1 Tax=Ajellomyces capsulatus (strain G186AR / H82 / ATCC MYA-2454 / RMSCC 2432) TaxID=447093 RepID=C0NPW8_AJECG|nr:uncharacterized protein HCBG_05198 [Histoplasma capsulatum G186AR]EEH06978.1 predicted protein [Histoplasma capsulatum G186AR]